MTRLTNHMAVSSDSFMADTDPDVLAILDEYLAAIEQGKPVDVDEFIARRPDLADELTAYFDSINFLKLAAPDMMGFAESTAALEDLSGRSLGEYEIIRELGRGGMGVVYEAIQGQLDRRVALKVLPFAAVLDKRQTARFLIEAQAAAQLNHPNIVPVHGVGCERGVHYYSMQFIDGFTLEAAIDGLKAFAKSTESTTQQDGGPGADADTRVGFSTRRSTQDRAYALSVARLGIQAANALQHAHDFGIIHRDIKPSNLIVDESGKLWVTDFGLARHPGDTTLTLTGAVLGTVRYMSPEQAAGRRAMLDHRTDIYSLGVTLYELLTLRTPYDAADCQEFLHKIDRHDPMGVRRLNPAVPVDLETIVLKAISRHRRDRYLTAQDMADDLKRFTSGNPIAARRPSLSDRVSKWAGRHKTFVTAAAVALLLALGGTTVAALLVAHEQNATHAALTQSTANLQKAQANFRQSREVLDHFGVLVAERLADLPGAEQVRHELLQETLKYYQQFADQGHDDPLLQADLALTYFKAGELLERLGATSEAIESYEQATELFTQQLNQTNSSASLAREEMLDGLAACNSNIGLVYASRGEFEKAEQAYRLAIARHRERVAINDASPRAQLALASALGNFALMLGQADRRDDALTFHVEARRIQEALVASESGQVPALRELAMTLNNLSYYYRDEDLSQALQLNDEAIDLLQQAITAAPSDRLAADLALSLNNQGSLLARSDQPEAAQAAYSEAIEAYESILQRSPAIMSTRRDLAIANNNLGRTLNTLQRFEAAQVALERSRDVLQSLLRVTPSDAALLSSLGGVVNNLAMTFEATDRPESALAAYQEAIAYHRAAIERAPQLRLYVQLLDRTNENYKRLMQASHSDHQSPETPQTET